MKTKLGLVMIAAAFLAGPSAFAQDTLVDYLVKSCETELTNYCSDVTPGNGRLLHCMAAHEDKISGQCEYAFYKAASLLEELAMAINYVAKECATEIDSLCGGVELGEGRILACLDEHPDKVGDSCKKAVADTVGE